MVVGTQRFDPAGLATVSTQLVSGARWTSLRDSAMCRPWVIRALKESFTPVPFLVSRVRAALPADAHKNTFGVHLRDSDEVARSEEKEEDGEATMVQPGRRMPQGSACTIHNTHAAIADAVLSAARKNTAVHTVYVAASSGTMLARFRAYFEANASSLPAVGGRPRAIRLMTIADIMPNPEPRARTRRHQRDARRARGLVGVGGDGDALPCSIVDIWHACCHPEQ